MLSKVELIDPHSGVFSPMDVQRIVQIPLHTHSGTFSVRSTYYSELEHQFGSWLTRPDGEGSEHINHVC